MLRTVPERFYVDTVALETSARTKETRITRQTSDKMAHEDRSPQTGLAVEQGLSIMQLLAHVRTF